MRTNPQDEYCLTKAIYDVRVRMRGWEIATCRVLDVVCVVTVLAVVDVLVFACAMASLFVIVDHPNMNNPTVIPTKYIFKATYFCFMINLVCFIRLATFYGAAVKLR